MKSKEVGNCKPYQKKGIILNLTYTFMSVFLMSPVHSQTVFQRSNTGHHTQSSVGGGYYTLGGSIDYATLGKMDANGNFLWARNYDFGGSNVFTYSMTSTSDSGAIIAGSTYNGINFYPFLIKANKNGNTDFVKLYNKGGFYDVKQTFDHGFVACGMNSQKPIVVLTNSLGNVIWENTYESGILFSLSQCKDSSFIASGLINDNIFLLKISKNGSIQWAKEFNFAGQDNGQCVLEDKDGGFIVSGQAGFITSPFQQSKGCLLKTDKNGNLIWCRLLKDLDMNTNQQIGTANYITIGKNNEYVLLNYTMVNFQGTNNLVKISHDLKLSWAKDYADGVSGNVNFSGTVFSLNDNTYLLSKWNGKTYKADSMGNSGCTNKPANFELIDSLPAINNLSLTATSFNSEENTTVGITTATPNYYNILEPIDSLEIVTDGDPLFCKGKNTILYAHTKTNKGNTPNLLWSNGENQSMILADHTARYTLRATSLSHCIRDTFLDVTELPLPPTNISVSGSTIFCEGDSVILSAASGNYSYQWWPGGNMKTASIAVKTTGQYQVTIVNNDTKCQATSSYEELINITVKPKPSAQIEVSGPTGFCSGDSVTLTADTASNYLWSNGATTQSIVVKTSDNYSILLTGSNGCEAKSDTIKVSSVSDAIPEISILAENDTACLLTNMKFTAKSMYEGNAPSYIWRINNISQGPGFAQTQFMLQDGDIVDCILTSNMACATVDKDTSNAIKITVIDKPETPGSIIGESSFCEGLSKSYRINSINGADRYTWEVPEDAELLSGQGTDSVFVKFGSVTGQLRVTSGNICGSRMAQFKNIIIGNAPTDPVSISGADTVCANSIIKFYSVNFIANADSFIWSLPKGTSYRSGEGTGNIVIDYGSQSGNISVKAINGCGTTKAFIKPITVITTPELTDEISGLTSICENVKGIHYQVNPLQGTSSYQWEITGNAFIQEGNGTNSVLIDFYNNDAQIKVKAMNNCGAGSYLSKNVSIKLNPKPTISKSNNILTSSDAALYKWLINGDKIKDATEKTLTANATGYYQVSVNNSGCTNISDSLLVTVIEELLIDLNQKSYLSIYPNPVKNWLQIENKDEVCTLISVLSLNGMVVKEFTVHAQKTELDFSDLSTGIYILKIRTNKNTVHTSQIIKL